MPKVIKAGAVAGYQSTPPTSGPRPNKPVARMGKKPIIEKEIVGAEARAREILEEAAGEASSIVDEASQQAEDLRQKGYDEGYQEGLGQYTEQVMSALMEVERYKAAVEPEYIRLVTACVEKIIGHELKSDPEAIVGIVRNALKSATQQREVNVRVNPADVAVLRKNQRKLLDVLARANTIEIREDETVARGGCIIVTELGTIDASLERQLKALEKVLMTELETGDPDQVFEDEPEADEDEDEYE